MAEYFHNLRRLRFPDVVKPALLTIEKLVCQQQDALPGMGQEELMEEIVEEFLFQRPRRKSAPHRPKLNAIEELQFVETLLNSFQTQASDITQQAVFRVIFDNYNDQNKREILCKLVSMAIGAGCSEVLNACGAWLQIHSCHSEVASFLCSRIVQDFLDLSSGSGLPLCLRQLPRISPLFTCNLTTALTHLYLVGSIVARRPCEIPPGVLEVVTEWICQDPALCLSSIHHTQNAQKTNLWTSPSKPNTLTPVPGLARWCIHAPFSSYALLSEANNKMASALPVATSPDQAQSKIINYHDQVWSKLHMAVLETILQFPGVPNANQLELFTLSDMNQLIKSLADNYAHVHNSQKTGGNSASEGSLGEDSQSDLEFTKTCLDRLLQVIQVSLKTGAFRCSLGDLKRIFSSLPPSPLLPILERHHFDSGPPQMHF